MLSARIAALLSVKRLSSMTGTERLRKEKESQHLCGSNVINVYLRQTYKQLCSRSGHTKVHYKETASDLFFYFFEMYSCRI